MPAGGFKTFIAGEVLDENDINDYLMQGVLVFAGTAARGSAITAPVEGQFSYLSDTNLVQFYDGSAWVDFESGPEIFDFIVVGGGGSGGKSSRAGNSGVGGGGAGGAGGLSFGSGYCEVGDIFTVTVGAGGAVGATAGLIGNKSVFHKVIQGGGGGGGYGIDSSANFATVGGPGACSGGAASAAVGGTSSPGQDVIGFAGGSAAITSGGGGGGGMGAAGAAGNGGVGGIGLTVNTILTTAQSTALAVGQVSGSDVYFCGGGGGGSNSATVNTGGNGGLGGGGKGGDRSPQAPVAGTANTGGGGGGSAAGALSTTQTGGSGVVVLKYSADLTLTIGAGLTATTITSGLFKITAFKSGSDTITVG
jgi:hypothetical protein